MELAGLLSEIQSYFDDPPTNEANTCDLVIRPLLLALGYLPREITRESQDQGGNRPDYTILPNDQKFKFHIEVKAWNVDLENKHVNQATTYAHQNGTRWVILTNGRIWCLYDNYMRGLPTEKLAIEINIRNQVEALAFFGALRKDSFQKEQLEPAILKMRETRPLKPILEKLEIPMSATRQDVGADSSHRYFWHICVHKNKPDRRMDDNWWNFLKQHGQISCGFQGKKDDMGDTILNSYQKGDTIVAYATGSGAIGWGIIVEPRNYRLLKPGDPEDRLAGDHLHRLNIQWQAVADRIDDALSAADIKEKYDVSHPPKTSQPIYAKGVSLLIDEMTKIFGSAH